MNAVALVDHAKDVRAFLNTKTPTNYRTVMRRRWREWDVISQTTAFAEAA